MNRTDVFLTFMFLGLVFLCGVVLGVALASRVDIVKPWSLADLSAGEYVAEAVVNVGTNDNVVVYSRKGFDTIHAIRTRDKKLPTTGEAFVVNERHSGKRIKLVK